MQFKVYGMIINGVLNDLCTGGRIKFVEIEQIEIHTDTSKLYLQIYAQCTLIIKQVVVSMNGEDND